VLVDELIKLANYATWVSNSNTVGRNISYDNTARSDNRVIADAYARTDNATPSYPDVVSNVYRFCCFQTFAALFRIYRVQSGIDVNPGSDLGVIADSNEITVEKHASVVDESIAANPDVLSVIAGKRRFDLADAPHTG